MEKVDYRVQYEDNQYEVPLRSVMFREYESAASYYNEKVEDNTGRYKKILLIGIVTTIKETVLEKK